MDLLARVKRVQTAARRLTFFGALYRLIALVFAIVAVAAFIDFALRPQQPAVRWTMSGVVLAAALACALRLLRPAISYRPGLIAIARRIELRFPVLEERLSIAVAFLE